MSDINFDHVSIQKAGGWNLIPAEKFLQLPIDERVSMVIAGKAKFIRDGAIISARAAFQARATAKTGT